jgi:hypothetical protein
MMGETTADAVVGGVCDRGFQQVGEALAGNFARGGEVGAAVAVTVDSKPVVDLWAGYADAARIRPWKRDTIVTGTAGSDAAEALFSGAASSPKLAAIMRNLFAEQHQLAAPIAEWAIRRGELSGSTDPRELIG